MSVPWPEPPRYGQPSGAAGYTPPPRIPAVGGAPEWTAPTAPNPVQERNPIQERNPVQDRNALDERTAAHPRLQRPHRSPLRHGRTGPDDRGERPEPVSAPGPAAEPRPGPEPGTPPRGRGGRAGRNLPAAIAIGLVLGAVVLASLFIWPPAFLAVILLAQGAATWEMGRALRPNGVRVPLTPLLIGGVAMVGLAWFGHLEGLVIGLVLTVVVAMIWRLADGPAGYHRDVAAATLIAVYVPFLAGFAVLLLHAEDGNLRVLITLAAVVLSDTGGYAVGVLIGRHPMAPTVSPKKSWEGLGGSLLAAGTGGAILLVVLFHQVWWKGAVLGVAVAIAGVLGDLIESLIKRDLKIKDMSNLLPGHGGVMDRLDSVLFAIPTAFILLNVLSPHAT